MQKYLHVKYSSRFWLGQQPCSGHLFITYDIQKCMLIQKRHFLRYRTGKTFFSTELIFLKHPYIKSRQKMCIPYNRFTIEMGYLVTRNILKVLPHSILGKQKFYSIKTFTWYTMYVQLRAKQTAPLVNKRYENEFTLR